VNYREYREKRIKAAGILPVVWLMEPRTIRMGLEDSREGWIAWYIWVADSREEDEFQIFQGCSLYRFVLDTVVFPDEHRSKAEEEEELPE